MWGRADYTRVVVAIAATLWLLITAREVLQPLLIALFLWLLLNAMTRVYRRSFGGHGPRAVAAAKAASAATLAIAVAMLGVLLSSNAAELAEKLPDYAARLDGLLIAVAEALGLDRPPGVAELVERIELAPALLSIAGSAAAFIGSAIIIIVYMIFLNTEVGVAEAKLAAIVRDPDERESVRRIGEKILRDVEAYIGVKVVLGLVQGLPTYLVLSLLGVDAPFFWAMVIFFFSFVPTIGTMVGIVFPLLMTLLQFPTLTPALVVLVTLVPVQLFASNWLEPKMMGSSLNLSALVVLFGIFAGGAIWGIVGAIIIVPMLAVAALVFARIPSMRPVAVLLSRDGRLDGGGDEPGRDGG